MFAAQRHVLLFGSVGVLCLGALAVAIDIHNATSHTDIDWYNSSHTAWSVASTWVFAPYIVLTVFLLLFSLLAQWWDTRAEVGVRRTLPKEESDYVRKGVAQTRQALLKQRPQGAGARDDGDVALLPHAPPGGVSVTDITDSDVAMSLLLGHPVLTWAFQLTAIVFEGVVVSSFEQHWAPWFQALVFWLSGKLTSVILYILMVLWMSQLDVMETTIHTVQHSVGRSLMQNVLNPLIMFVVRIASRASDAEAQGGSASGFVLKVLDTDVEGIRNSYILSLVIAEALLWSSWLATRSLLPSDKLNSMLRSSGPADIMSSLEQLSFALLFPLVMAPIGPIILVDGLVGLVLVVGLASVRLATDRRHFDGQVLPDSMSTTESKVHLLLPYLPRVVYYGLYVCGLVAVGVSMATVLLHEHSGNTTAPNVAVWAGNILFSVVTALVHKNCYEDWMGPEDRMDQHRIALESDDQNWSRSSFATNEAAVGSLVGYALTCPDPLIPVFCFAFRYRQRGGSLGRTVWALVQRVLYLMWDTSTQIGAFLLFLLMGRMCANNCDSQANIIVTQVFAFALGPLVTGLVLFVCGLLYIACTELGCCRCCSGSRSSSQVQNTAVVSGGNARSVNNDDEDNETYAEL